MSPNLDKKRSSNSLYRVLIFAGSMEAKGLIEEIYKHYRTLGQYDIVYEEGRFIPHHISDKDRRIRLYRFEFEGNHYTKLLNKEYHKIVIAVKHKTKALEILKKIEDPFALITFVDYWGNLELKPFANLEVIDVSRLLTQRLVLSLPGVPMMAHDIGLGKGEIMEVEVPPGSQFVYKRAFSIYNPQKARVSLIYRKNKIILPNKNSVINPHDRLLLVGKPDHLEILFRQIKEQIGTFPVPFGNNILLIIDMAQMERGEILRMLNSALYLHKRLKNRKLLIRILHPSAHFDLTRIYRYYDASSIDIYTYYNPEISYPDLLEKVRNWDAGLLLTTNRYFYKYRRHLFQLRIPILKQGRWSLKSCDRLFVIMHDHGLKEVIPVIFDIAFQLGKKLIFIEGDPEQKYHSLKSYINHFVKIYGLSNVEFWETPTNVTWELKKKEEGCLIHPFLTYKLSKIAQIFNPKIEQSFIMLDNLSQFLIPVEGLNES